ncbi:MAG: protein kinase domain-containing protein [Thermoanaerobaculia bacterium]
MTLAAGTRLGPYEILGALGAGGMGEVYRARDTRLGREVAVKVVSEQLGSDPELLSRFEREARAVAALSHPNILTIHDFGRDQGISYAVTELLEGETLRVRMAHSSLTWQKAVEIGIAVADGLAAAHSRGIIHRDLKPENIFLTSDGRVKVLDFGLARWKPAAPSEDKTSAPTEAATEPGIVLGTVGYMSPEQIRGQAADVPSDVFSLGCVLFEMGAGRRAFSGHTSAETMAAILKDDTPELSSGAPDAPEELSRIVTRCLDKNPEQRFQSARDLAFDLRAVLNRSATSKVSSGKTRKSIDSLAVLPLSNAGGDPETEYLSDGITETLINSLSRLPDLCVMARSTVFRYKGRDVDALEAGRELRVRAVLTGRVLHRGDSLVVKAELVDLTDGSQLWGEQYSRKISDIFAVQEEIARQILEALRVKLTGEEKEGVTRRYTESSEAYRLYLKGRFYWNKRTSEGVRRGIEYFSRAIEADPEYALAYAGLADGYNILGFYTVLPAREAFPKAKAAASKALEIDGSLAEARASLAYARHYYDWDWAEAEREYRRAIELNPGYPTVHSFYANCLTTMGRHEEALAESGRAQELDPLSLIITTGGGWMYYFARRYDDAMRQIQKALEMDATFVPAHWFLGLAYEQKGMDRDAVEELRKAVEFSGGGTLMMAALAHAHAAFGRRSEAEKMIGELEALSAKKYVSPYYVALIHAALGDPDSAFRCLEKAYEERSHGLTFLKVDPQVDPLRSDPRYQDLLRRVGFPP